MSSAYALIMRVESSPLVLTAPEVAGVVEQLESKECCTVRQVRYLLSGFSRTDAKPPHSHARLYGPVDVALARLAVRLHAQGVSAWVSRVALAYCEEDLRAVWRTNAAMALVVRGVTATVEPVIAADTSTPVAARVPLRTVWFGVERAMRSTRRVRPLWRGRPVPGPTMLNERSA